VKPRAGEKGVTLIEMMIVVTIISLMAGLTYPAVSAGIDSVRLRSAADATSGFLSQAMARCERRQQAIEVSFTRNSGHLVQRAVDDSYSRTIDLPDGVLLKDLLPAQPENPEQRQFLLYPGGAFPRIGIELVNKRGARRVVRIDPVVGMPIVEQPKDQEGETASGGFQKVR
jgi:prepilin-type N-terminal cleavage/methylation domain-containing protein